MPDTSSAVVRNVASHSYIPVGRLNLVVRRKAGNCCRTSCSLTGAGQDAFASLRCLIHRSTLFRRDRYKCSADVRRAFLSGPAATDGRLAVGDAYDGSGKALNSPAMA